MEGDRGDTQRLLARVKCDTTVSGPLRIDYLAMETPSLERPTVQLRDLRLELLDTQDIGTLAREPVEETISGSRSQTVGV